MNSFQDMALASLAGITSFFLIEALYCAILEKFKKRQIQAWLDELEEEE